MKDAQRCQKLIDIFSLFRFNNNKAELNGAALHLYRVEKILILRSSFNRNIANSTGGAVYIRATSLQKDPAVTVSGCTFVTNRAEMQGGAMAAKGGITVTLEKSTFVRNSALTGGAVYAISDFDHSNRWKMTIRRSKFTENKGMIQTLRFT